MSRTGRRLRSLGLLLGLSVLLLGSLRGSDDWFPFGPFLMYAGGGPTNGTVESTRLEATTVSGHRMAVPERVSGLRRAELEGQLASFIAHPERLAAVAAAQTRRRPSEPHYIQVDIVQRRYEVRDRRLVGQSDAVLASWRAP